MEEIRRGRGEGGRSICTRRDGRGFLKGLTPADTPPAPTAGEEWTLPFCHDECGSAVADVTGCFPSANSHYLCTCDVKFRNKTEGESPGTPDCFLPVCELCVQEAACVVFPRRFPLDLPVGVCAGWILPVPRGVVTPLGPRAR